MYGNIYWPYYKHTSKYINITMHVYTFLKSKEKLVTIHYFNDIAKYYVCLKRHALSY